MADQKKLTKLVESTVAEVFGERIESLRDEVSHRVFEALEPIWKEQEEKLAAAEAAAEEARKDAEEAKKHAAAAPPSGGSPTDILFSTIASIHDAAGQADILKALLDGISKFSPRVALFVMKGGNLSGWQARGFEDNGALKGLSIDGNSGLAGRAIRDKETVSAAAAEFSDEFVSTHGNPVDGNALVLPLVVRDKVAAAVYADAGTEADGRCDGSAAQVLVRSAANHLEILALRKAGGAAVETAPEPAAEPAAPAPPPPATMAAAAPAAEPSGLSSEDEEVHKKAKRFARLLVDEIKLYNQSKVNEGRQHKDIYDRLKEDIDKSRATYEKRYGTTSAAGAGYFTAEVVRILADNDPSNMGAGFQG
jgi:hypothetical protein